MTNTNDSGAGSLRDAISAAASGDTINFSVSSCPCTITLTSGQLAIGKTLTITGPATGLTISGNNASRVMRVTAGGDLTLNNLTIANGQIDTADNGSYGAGIQVVGGTLKVLNATFRNNIDNADFGVGGAIAVGDADTNTGGTLELSNSTLANNSANFGGALSAYAAHITITNSMITANRAAFVGGILVSGSSSGNASVVSLKIRLSPGILLLLAGT